MGFKRKRMQALTLHIELFALQRLLFRFYNLLCRTARCAQPSVPEVNLICTNKELHYKDTTIISKMQAKKRRSLTSHRHFVTNGFYAPLYKYLHSNNNVCTFTSSNYYKLFDVLTSTRQIDRVK